MWFQEEDAGRGTFSNKLDFLFSCISVSVGLGTVNIITIIQTRNLENVEIAEISFAITYEFDFQGSHVKGKTVENTSSEHGINIEHMKNDERVKNLNMTEFYIETLPDVFIVYCEYPSY